MSIYSTLYVFQIIFFLCAIAGFALAIQERKKLHLRKELAKGKARATILVMNMKALASQDPDISSLFAPPVKSQVRRIVHEPISTWLQKHRDHDTIVHTPSGFGKSIRVFECRTCREHNVTNEILEGVEL